MLLTRHVFNLHGASVGKVVRVVDLHTRLHILNRKRHELKLQRTIRKFSESTSEVGIYRPCVDRCPTWANQVPYFLEWAVEQNADFSMSQHSLKHGGESLFGHYLMTVPDISFVAIETDRNPTTDIRIQIAWVNSPLLESVVQVKRLI